MANVIINGDNYTDIDEVYLRKVGEDGEERFVLPGDEANIQPLNVSENGTYRPGAGVDGYAPVVVNVPSERPETQEKTVTPTAAGVEVTPDSGKLLSKVTVNGDANLIPANIAKDVSIFGVQGVHEGGGVTIEEGDVTAVGGESMISTGCTFIPDIVLVYTDEHYYEGGFDFGQTPLSFYVTNKSAGNVYSGIGQYGDSQDNDPAYMIWSGYLYIQQDTFHLGSFWEQAVNGEWWFATKTYHWVAVKYT